MTYQELIKVEARDWHKLRLYVAGNLQAALVTPLRKPGRKPAPRYNNTKFKKGCYIPICNLFLQFNT